LPGRVLSLGLARLFGQAAGTDWLGVLDSALPR
jgi:hypothetical protein